MTGPSPLVAETRPHSQPCPTLSFLPRTQWSSVVSKSDTSSSHNWPCTHITNSYFRCLATSNHYITVFIFVCVCRESTGASLPSPLTQAYLQSCVWFSWKGLAISQGSCTAPGTGFVKVYGTTITRPGNQIPKSDWLFGCVLARTNIFISHTTVLRRFLLMPDKWWSRWEIIHYRTQN